MKTEEVLLLVKFVNHAERRRGEADHRLALTAAAWWSALDYRIDLQTAQWIVTGLISRNEYINPGTINRVFLESIRPPHQPYPGQPRLPGVEPVMLQLEAEPEMPEESPVRAADLPFTVVDGKPVVQYREALAFPCPWCKAEKGRQCSIPNTHRTTDIPHPSRFEAAGLPDPSTARLVDL